MARITLNEEIPVNIIELSREQAHLAPAYFERGWLIVLKDIRISADFEFLSAIDLPKTEQTGHVKFFLTHARQVQFDANREKSWSLFRNRVFVGNAAEFDRFYEEVGRINDQLHSLGSEFFPDYDFATKRVCWKFENITGQNLHIDNIAGSQDRAQLRIFTNLATTPRLWSIAEHISTYAERFYERADLSRFRDAPVQFNHSLSAAAFGNSAAHASDPRHFVEFDPGDVWILNSAITAHQVRRGTLLALDCMEFPYDNYQNPEEALPAVLAKVHHRHYQAAPVLAVE